MLSGAAASVKNSCLPKYNDKYFTLTDADQSTVSSRNEGNRWRAGHHRQPEHLANADRRISRNSTLGLHRHREHNRLGKWIRTNNHTNRSDVRLGRSHIGAGELTHDLTFKKVDKMQTGSLSD